MLYHNGQHSMYGVTRPVLLPDHAQLVQPLITPTSMAFDNDHGERLPKDLIIEAGLLLAARLEGFTHLCIGTLPPTARSWRRYAAFFLKCEYGAHENSTIIRGGRSPHCLQHSRCWLAESYVEAFEAGKHPQTLAIDFIRAWVGEGSDPFRYEISSIEAGIIAQNLQSLYQCL